MINLQKAAAQIRSDGLFSPIYDKMREEAGGRDLSVEEIRELLQDPVKSQDYLDTYRRINRESDISNIQLKELSISEADSRECRELKRRINANADRLRALEKYGSSAGESAYSIWIGSLAVFLIFAIHNYFGLFTNVYHTRPYLIFGAYLLVIIWAFRFYFKTMKNHERKHRRYVDIHAETHSLVRRALALNCFRRADLFD